MSRGSDRWVRASSLVDCAATLAGKAPWFRATNAQVPQYARAWREERARAQSASGPLWVVCGDSAAQGVGAGSYDAGYVGQLREWLQERDRCAWRVINLSRSGARTREVIEDQLPLLTGLPPADLVTAVVGGNDVLHTPLARWYVDIEALVEAVPAGSVVATVSRGLWERKARRGNARLLTSAARRGLPVADLWAHTGPPYRGNYADGFHPNAAGYRQWTAALIDALAVFDEQARPAERPLRSAGPARADTSLPPPPPSTQD